MLITYFYPVQDRPILAQLQPPYLHAAMILSPFISMPKSTPNTLNERFQRGTPVYWGTAQRLYGFESYQQVEDEVMKHYGQTLGSEKIQDMERDLTIPKLGCISEKLIANLSSLLGSKGAKKVFYRYKGNQVMEMNLNFDFPETLTELCKGPITVKDENEDFMISSGEGDPFCLVFSREPLDVFWPCDFTIADQQTKARIDKEVQVIPSQDVWYFPNYDLPILDQAPPPFQSAAIIRSPFMQMANQRIDENKPFTVKEIQSSGKPVTWQEMKEHCGFNSIVQLGEALDYWIGLGEREDLYNRLRDKMPKELYAPNEDNFSELLIRDFLRLIASKGAKKANFTSLSFPAEGVISLVNPSEEDLELICKGPTTIVDEKNDFMLTCFFDSFSCILYSRDKSIKELIQPFGWEVIVCDEKTKGWRE